MKKSCILIALTLGLASGNALAGFTAGNVVVLQVTNNSTGGGGALVEFSTSGPSGYQVALPFATSDTASSIAFGNNSTLNHDITLSGDGAFVVVPGYAYGTNVAVDTSLQPRVMALVKYDGTYSKPISAYVQTWAFRGGASDGFGNFWGMTGTGGSGAEAGTIYMGLGTTATVQPTTGRAVGVYNGNLHYTVGDGVHAYTGTPTTASGAAPQIIVWSAMGGAGTANSASFAIPPNPVVGSIAYLVDYNTSPNPGVGHYHWTGSSWSWDYNVALPGGLKAQHVAVNYANPVVPIVYVTPTAGAGNTLYYFVDNSSTPTVNLLATAPAGQAFRGVAMAPTAPAAPCPFTVQPVGQTNDLGTAVSFGPVTATGANPSAYTWKRGTTTIVDGPSGTGSGSIISGATTATLTITGIGFQDQGFYSAVAHNNGPGTCTSDGAYLKVNGSCISPALTPVNVVCVGSTVNLVGGTNSCLQPASVAWTYNDSPLGNGTGPSGSSTISGAGTPHLTISNAQHGDEGTYKLTVIDATLAPSVSSASLALVDTPWINIPPGPQDKAVGQTASFTVDGQGGGLSYQWLKNTAPINDGTTGHGSFYGGTHTATLYITNVQTADAGSYSCRISNACSTATSDPGVLTTGIPATITVPPVSLIVTGGNTAVFSATVTGSGTITYSWKHNSDQLFDDGKHSGTGTATLTTTDVQLADAQTYTLTVNNSYGGASASAVIRFVYGLPQPQGIPGLVIYEPFKYPTQTYAQGAPINSFQDIISAWNEVTGQPAWWERLGQGSSTIRDETLTSTGLYPWKGIDCAVDRVWYWSSAPNNNHLKFGGINQTSGAAYFSFVFQATQGSAMNDNGYDLIAGLTSGEGPVNADTWVYKLCTHLSNGGDGYQLGVFKGGGTSIGSGSVNGEWVPTYFGRGSTHFIVGCYKFNSGTNLVGGSITNDDVVSLWIDPDRSTFGVPEGSRPAPTAGGSITNWGANAPITEFGLKGLVPPASKTIADLRIGTTWASVTHPYYPTIKQTNDPAFLTLSWPAKDSADVHGTGYVLQEGSDLFNWSLSGYTPSQDGAEVKVTVSPGAGPFFRLIYP